MKHTYLSFFILISILFSSCSEKIVDEDSMKTAVSEITATLVDNGTKTELADDEKNILWSPDDEINVFYEDYSVKFKSTNTKPEQTAVFRSNPTALFVATESTVDADEPYFVGTYPYNINNTSDGESATVTIPDAQIATCGSFAPNSFVAIGRSKDTNIAFYNVCGGIRFSFKDKGINKITITGNNGEMLAGTVKVVFEGKLPRVSEIKNGKKSITLTAADGTFKVGKWYYASVLPTEFTKGMSFVIDRVDAIGHRSITSNVCVKRSTIGSLPTIDKNAEFTPLAIDLSRNGTANCYIVSESGRYKFKATTKGGSSESVGKPESVEILWESFGTDVIPSVGSVVERASFFDGYIGFATPDTLNNGNAVIAVKDINGNILWSWHIWICKDFDPAKTAHVYKNNAGTMMDRNLGAISATPGAAGTCGLMYQWGRKDPFLGGSSKHDSATSTLLWPSPVSSNSSNGTFAYAIAHPTTFITYNKNNYDWYYCNSESTDNTRWQTLDLEKGLYDPCPYGWRVPNGGENGIWSTAFGYSSYYYDIPFDSQNIGMDFGSNNGKSSNTQLGTTHTIWYPCVGQRDNADGSLQGFGYNNNYWSCTTTVYVGAYIFCFGVNYFSPSSGTSRAFGHAVRCVAEK